MRSSFPGRDVDRLYPFIRLGELVRYPDVDLRAFPIAARRLKGRYCALFPGSDIGYFKIDIGRRYIVILVWLF